MSDMIQRIIRADVQATQAYPVPDASGMVKLDAMENPYQLPVALRDELGRRLASLEVNRYPAPRAPALRAALARTMAVPAGCDILLGNGSDELIGIITTACARPGAKILSPVPTFVMYEVFARYANVPFIGVPLKADFSLDLEAILVAIKSDAPAVTYLSYPNNPTGNLFPRSAVEAIIKASPGLVVVDEAYQAFAGDSFMGDAARYENLVVMRTISKSGLAGARLGYMAARKEWIDEFDKVRPPYNINVFTQCYAEFALEHIDVLDEQARLIRAERATLATALAATDGVAVFPSDANFLLFRIESDDAAAATQVFEELKKEKVLVKNLSRAHPLLANCLRVTVSTPAENLRFQNALVLALSRTRSSLRQPLLADRS